MLTRDVCRVQCSVPYDPDECVKAIKGIVWRHCSTQLMPEGANGAQQCMAGMGSNGVPSCEEEESNVADDLHVVALCGGITNELFHVYLEGCCAHSVVVRVFGKETDYVISREDELFYQQFFIPTYVRGDNFLIYKYLDQHEPLPFTDLITEYEKIAHEIAAFHVRATLEARGDRTRTASGSPCVSNNVPTTGEVGEPSRFDLEENYTVHSLTDWVGRTLSEAFLNKVDPERRDCYVSVAQQLLQEAPRMLRLLAKHAPEMGEVTCHNDLLSANIMRHKGSGALKIIDFEYAKRNYFLFDIANHLNEYAGLECDYGTHFPCDDHIKAFIVCYLRAMRYHLHLYSDEAQLRGLTNIIPGQQHYFMFDVSVDEESQRVGRMLQQVKLLTLASHLSWSIWALLQEAVSTINMDFLQYSKLRLARYFETKEEFGLREI